MNAFLFTGQGSDPPWVDADVLAAPQVAPLIAHASAACDADLARMLARGGRDLARTELLQPAMVAICLGVHRLLAAAGVAPALVAGHSLGELAAWSAAGAITAEVAIELAALRGRAMAREAARHPGGMVRLVGDPLRCVADASRHGAICIGAQNGEGEWVLSGEEPALAHAIAHHGATRLAMAGAWHSPAMAGAVAEVEAALAAARRAPMRVPMIANRDGSYATDATAPALLAGQLVHPVDWAATIATAAAAGTDRYLVLGPGKIMRALIYRNLGPRCRVEIADGLRAIAAIAERST